MTMQRALQAILTVAVIGLVFSGVLTYREFFGSGAIASCPSPGAPGTVFGYPACVYGFFMYVIITGLAVLGLRAKS
jgi:ABC-type tungstate transport system substrate-binding protein